MVPIVNHPDYVAQIGDDHRFPINKFGALFQLLQQDKIIKTDNLFIPEPVSHADLLRVHKAEYIEKIDNYLYLKKKNANLDSRWCQVSNAGRIWQPAALY